MFWCTSAKVSPIVLSSVAFRTSLSFRLFVIKELDCRPAKHINSSVYSSAPLNTPVNFCTKPDTESTFNSPSRAKLIRHTWGRGRETPAIFLLPKVRFRWRHLQNKSICFLTSLSVFLDKVPRSMEIKLMYFKSTGGHFMPPVVARPNKPWIQHLCTYLHEVSFFIHQTFIHYFSV